MRKIFLSLSLSLAKLPARLLAMSVFARLSEALTMCSRPDVRPVRTAADPPMGPNEALSLLKEP